MLRLLLILNLLTVTNAFAQIDFTERSKYIQLNQLLTPEYENFQDISHVQLVPQFEDQQSPENAATLEISYAEINNTPESDKRLQWLRDQLAQEQSINPNIPTEILVLGKNKDELQNNPEMLDLIDSFNTFRPEVSFDEVPESRSPSAMSGRTLWTLIRFTTTTSGAFMSIYFTKDISPQKAFAIGAVSGLASAGLTYFSGAYGRYLTNGAWARWLVESESTFASGLRKSFGITGKSFAEMLTQNRKDMMEKFPELARKTELFEGMLLDETQRAFDEQKIVRSRMLAKMQGGERYLKWWINTNLYTTIAVKIPQAVGGLATSTSILQATGDILTAGTMNFFAQGPGSLAIEIRKYQMVEELERTVRNGDIIVKNKQKLLNEIKKVLAKSGPHANYVINDASHQALQRIENWARSRQTMLSFFSVVGVAMEVSGVPLGRPILISMGVGGGFYYAKVNGTFSAKTTLGKYAEKLIQPFIDGKAYLKSLPIRHCFNNFFRRI